MSKYKYSPSIPKCTSNVPASGVFLGMKQRNYSSQNTFKEKSKLSCTTHKSNTLCVKIINFFTYKKLFIILVTGTFLSLVKLCLFSFFPDISLKDLEYLWPSSIAALLISAMSGIFYDHITMGPDYNSESHSLVGKMSDKFFMNNNSIYDPIRDIHRPAPAPTPAATLGSAPAPAPAQDTSHSYQSGADQESPASNYTPKPEWGCIEEIGPDGAITYHISDPSNVSINGYNWDHNRRFTLNRYQPYGANFATFMEENDKMFKKTSRDPGQPQNIFEKLSARDKSFIFEAKLVHAANASTYNKDFINKLKNI